MNERRNELRDALFYAILDTGYVSREHWKETAARLIAGGADLIQVRAKRESGDERERLLQDVLTVLEKMAGSRPHLILNDDVGLCAQYPGVGLHIGQDDMPPEEARLQIGPGRLLGLSTHSRAQAAAALSLPAGVLDYFCIGPVFATATKPDYEPVGLELVRWTAARRPSLPWFCIGGVTRENIGEVMAAGARRAVVVSDVLQAHDPAMAVAELRRRLVTATA